jgi:hypothetical protein
MEETAPRRRLPRIPAPDLGRIARRAQPQRGLAGLFRRS